MGGLKCFRSTEGTEGTGGTSGIILDRCLVGWTNTPRAIVSYLREQKYKGILPFDVCTYYVPSDNEVIIATNDGRLIRRYHVVNHNKY